MKKPSPLQLFPNAHTLSLALLLLTGLSACGSSACDELSDMCDSCSNPTQKAICKQHVKQGDEDVCELDLDIFEMACTESSLLSDAYAEAP